jgi:hypothetical protein
MHVVRALEFERPDADLNLICFKDLCGFSKLVLYFYPRDDTRVVMLKRWNSANWKWISVNAERWFSASAGTTAWFTAASVTNTDWPTAVGR